MISQQSYNPEWIESFRRRKEYHTINPPLFEKVIFAFALLEMLTGSCFDFIFKGGSSLLLMPVGSDRFSTDIDIITEKSKKELELSIHKAIGSSVFTSFREDKERTNKGGIPKAHYIFDFKAIYNKDGNILLDVLFEKNPYPSLSKVEIKCNWIDTMAPYFHVSVPSINSILGDKLTAFAPNTTGIPYWLNNPKTADKRIEIIKQLYDISNLINYCNDSTETNNVFQTIATYQISYRKLDITINDVIDDVFNKEITNTGFNFLNRFKRTNKQSFFYWYQCLELMDLVK